MADIEDGEVNEVEQTTVDKGLDSEVEFLEEDKDAGEFFEFTLPTQGWAKEMTKHLGLPAGLVNPYLPTEPMTPASIERHSSGLALSRTAAAFSGPGSMSSA